MAISMTMTFESAAHKHLEPVPFDVEDYRKWNVDLAKQMDVMSICNVMNDEFARFEISVFRMVGMIMIGVVGMVVLRVIGLLNMFMTGVVGVILVSPRNFVRVA
tara:strand:- start:8 stop:319 length:312 start_codon:yes stop_codon:yes gene_type:complete